MRQPKIRVMVGEGRSTRKDLLRFVLENEGYDVVAEAGSTLELAQKIVVHRPDVVVLDDGIDASAVGMLREVLPSAKVILVWPRGVAAVGADARIEPAEVMTSLGATVARVTGGGSVMAPPRPRVPAPDVIVVPEPEGTEPAAAPPAVPTEVAPPAVPEPTTVTVPEFEAETAGSPPGTEREEPSIGVAPEALSGVMMEPSPLEAPRWTYTAPSAAQTDARRRRGIAIGIAAAVILAVVAGVFLLNRPASVRSSTSPSASIGQPTPTPTPTPTPSNGGVADRPGTYHGVVHVRASGTIVLVGTGDVHLRITGLMRVVAHGDVHLRGNGVVKSVSSSGVRVRGNGSLRIGVEHGRVFLRVRGSVQARGEGTIRVRGHGRFFITHHPI